MKKFLIGLFLMCLLCAPYVAHAADHCTNPDEYTVDKRCYVTDEQKQEKPYNATVALNTFWVTYCTGSIAKWNHGLTNTDFSDLDDLFYLFTAKHCTDNNDDNIPDSTLKIKLQNGNTFRVTLVGYGNYDIKTWANPDGDWAVYRLPVDLIKDLNDLNWVYVDADAKKDNRPVVSVGYGALKIMSDKDIEDFKQKYMNYLERKGIDKEETDVGIDYYGGIETYYSEKVKKFMGSFRMIFANREFFMDNELLKFSRCYFSDDSDCQGWHGNSGGPLFDDENRLVGITTSGLDVIGGKLHAQSTDEVPTGYIYQEMNKMNLGPGLIYVEKTKE